ncbi:hypothetical protein AB0M25_06370 [Streptomyces griseomycini]|uniref:hypothetical protein n=1 Tax=Streptomyces griseomycini TaxID=66895 RepID=UPI0034454A1A
MEVPVRAAADSWLVTCDVDLEPGASDDPEVRRIWQPLQIRYTTFAQNNEAFWHMRSRLGNDGEFSWGDRHLRAFGVRTSEYPGDFEKALHYFLYLSFSHLGYEGAQPDLLADSAFDPIRQVPVPRLGSAPSGWGALGTLIAGGGPATAAVLEGLGPNPSLLYASSMAGLSVIMTTIVMPAARGVGRGLERGLERKIDGLFGAAPNTEGQGETGDHSG